MSAVPFLTDCQAQIAKIWGIPNGKNELLLQRAMDECLNINNQALQKVLDEQSNQLDQLTQKISELSGKFGQTADMFDGYDTLVQTLHSTYQNWFIGISLLTSALLAAAGILTFVFLGKYQKREIQKIADKAKKKVEKQIGNGDLLSRAVTAALGTQEDALAARLWKKIEPMLAATMADKTAPNQQDVRDFQAFTTQTKNEGQKERDS